MKKSIFYLISFFFLINSVSGQEWISIVGKSPYPQGVKVFFEGYEGFQKKDLGSIRTTANGMIDYFSDYHGYCMMTAEGRNAYPLILEYDTVCVDWGGEPKLFCDPENEYFYNNLQYMYYLDSLYNAYRSSNDSLEKERLCHDLDSAFISVYSTLMSGESQYAKVFMQAELMIRHTRMAEDTGQMASRKDDILAFITDNYEVLYYSDYIGKMAGAYLEMNNTVFENETALQQALENDVDVWVNSFGPVMGGREVIDFFLIHFIKMGEMEVAANMVTKYLDLVKCELYVSSNLRPAGMPYSFNVFGGADYSKVYTLDQFKGISKILAIFSTECPASLAAVTGLYDFISENQIRMPVILMPNFDPEGELADLLNEKAPFGMQVGVKTGNAISSGAGVKQLPAFMILDERNLLERIIYDFDELKQMLGGDD